MLPPKTVENNKRNWKKHLGVQVCWTQTWQSSPPSTSASAKKRLKAAAPRRRCVAGPSKKCLEKNTTNALKSNYSVIFVGVVLLFQNLFQVSSSGLWKETKNVVAVIHHDICYMMTLSILSSQSLTCNWLHPNVSSSNPTRALHRPQGALDPLHWQDHLPNVPGNGMPKRRLDGALRPPETQLKREKMKRFMKRYKYFMDLLDLPPTHHVSGKRCAMVCRDSLLKM